MCISVIEKKILPEYFEAVISGNKTFELRKDVDNIKEGDYLLLKEWTGTEYTGRLSKCFVSYVLRDCKQYGLMEGYCVIGIKATPFDVSRETLKDDLTKTNNPYME